MGWYSQQAMRLLRQKWKNPTQLAEELYAILSSEDLPMETTGPVTIDKGATDEPGLTMRGFSSGDFVIKIEKNKDDPEPFLYRLGDDGVIGPMVPETPPQNPQGVADQKQKGQTDPGQFLSIGEVTGGSGSTYQVALADGKAIEATVRQIAADEVIPTGTTVYAVKVGQTWYIQPAVWL